jgi:acetolactate synthase-1/2/3 large subunit
MNVAEYLAKFLKAAGVTHIYGVPGGENVLVIEAFRRTGLTYVLVHHEASAGFAADVTGQLTDRPGICMATVGPGAMNLLSAAVAATLERSPVLAITADIDPSLQSRVTHMRTQLEALYATGTKGSFRLTPQTVGDTLSTAWRLALTPPRGAVHLAISPEVALSKLGQNDFEPDLSDIDLDIRLDEANPAVLETIAKRTHQASHPFILAGLGVEATRSQIDLLRLAEAWQVPVAVTPKAKGHFPENHPLFAGCITAYGDEPLRQALTQADLILGVGLDGVDLVTSLWDIETPLINLSPARADDPVFRPAISLDGHLAPMLSALHRSRAPDPKGKNRAEKLRTSISHRLFTPLANTPGAVKLNDLLAALRKVLPPEGTVTVDVGAFKLFFLQKWRTDHPKTFFVANGLSAMGYAIPAAVAIALAGSRQAIVALVGDGALLMYAGELATIARSGHPIIILVVVDRALALIRLKQLRQGTEVYGTEFGATDFEALASAFGLSYRLADQPDSIEETLQEALQLHQPVLVEARINKTEYNHFM